MGGLGIWVLSIVPWIGVETRIGWPCFQWRKGRGVQDFSTVWLRFKWRKGISTWNQNHGAGCNAGAGAGASVGSGCRGCESKGKHGISIKILKHWAWLMLEIYEPQNQFRNEITFTGLARQRHSHWLSSRETLRQLNPLDIGR